MSESMVVTTAQLIVVGAAVFVAAFMQIVAGFGFALLAVRDDTSIDLTCPRVTADRRLRHLLAAVGIARGRQEFWSEVTIGAYASDAALSPRVRLGRAQRVAFLWGWRSWPL